ncbi:MAG: Asp-tRNA(Asn)/Glu-tRNA(Gln) amidotransferase subunit GatB [Candidatus Aenigmatarchaeota archaeon]
MEILVVCIASYLEVKKKVQEKKRMTKIGLEVHIQLKTTSKLFCGCAAQWQGKEPNTNVCDTCLGMPGTKPRLNAKAIEYGIKVALALGCEMPKEMFFSRKNYFYPDMSKNYQISQYEIPIAKNGMIEVNDKKIHIWRINLEEDPARLVHPSGTSTSTYVLVDYNRSGVGLCEIVTAPDFDEPKEAREFLQELASVLEYLDVFDPTMEAAIRIDANVSVTGRAEDRVEIKNVSGFKDVQKALSYEIIRQKNIIGRSGKISSETRGWDPVAKITRLQRAKETAEDYGYIFEPDLTMQTLDAKFISKIKKTLPEMASEKVVRYKKFNVSEDLSKSIVQDPEFAGMFESVVKTFGAKDAPFIARIFAGEIKKTLNYNDMRIRETPLTEEKIIKLLKMIKSGELTERSAEMVLRDMVSTGNDVETIVKRKEMSRITDDERLLVAIDLVVSGQEKAVTDCKTGRKPEAFEFLVGCVMKETRGRADPQRVRGLLKKKING